MGHYLFAETFRCFLPSAFIIFMNVPHLKFLLLLNLFRLFIFFTFVCLFQPIESPSLALASNWTSYWKDQVQIQYFEPADLLSACHQSKEQSMVQLLLILRNAKLHIKCLPFNKPLELKLNICTSICVWFKIRKIQSGRNFVSIERIICTLKVREVYKGIWKSWTDFIKAVSEVLQVEI